MNRLPCTVLTYVVFLSWLAKVLDVFAGKKRKGNLGMPLPSYLTVPPLHPESTPDEHEELCEDEQEEMVEEAYECPLVTTKTECVRVPDISRKTCLRENMKKTEFPCTRIEYVSDCQPDVAKVVGICFRQGTREVPYDCSYEDAEEVCVPTKVEQMSVCTRPSKKSESYPCTKTVTRRECRMKSINKPYPCPETVYRTKCEPHDGTKHTLNPKQRKSFIKKQSSVVPEEMPVCRKVQETVQKTCNRVVSAEECEDVPFEESHSCTRIVNTEEEHACSKSVSVNKCETKRKIIRKTCNRSVPATQEYACEKTQYRTKCLPVPKEVPDTCYEGIPVTETFECPEMHLREECKTVPVTVPNICYRQVQRSSMHKGGKKQCRKKPPYHEPQSIVARSFTHSQHPFSHAASQVTGHPPPVRHFNHPNVKNLGMYSHSSNGTQVHNQLKSDIVSSRVIVGDFAMPQNRHHTIGTQNSHVIVQRSRRPINNGT